MLEMTRRQSYSLCTEHKMLKDVKSEGAYDAKHEFQVNAFLLLYGTQQCCCRLIYTAAVPSGSVFPLEIPIFRALETAHKKP